MENENNNSDINLKKIFLGPPNGGKGTAARGISNHFDTPHIATGDLFRHHLKNDTEIGLKAKGFMEAGELVPDEIVIAMLKDRIIQEDCICGFILDGFPRTVPQAEALKNITEIDLVINLEVNDEIVVSRGSSRIVCHDCGESYNMVRKPTKVDGVCDSCEGVVKRRKDDHPDTVQKRLNVYKQETQPLINFYRELGILTNIPCEDINQTPNELIENVKQAILDSIRKE